MSDFLKQVLREHEVYSYGICAFSRLSRLRDCRNRTAIPQNAKSVIVCAFPYYTGEFPESNLCRYARVRDYHVVLGELLRPVCDRLQQEFGGEYAWFTDNSPLPEKECALRAGLGILGNNNLVIHPEYGTYFVIGEIVTDREFPSVSTPIRNCIGCGACLRNCPGKAISENGVDYSRCVSRISQQKGSLSPDEKALIQKSGLAWGCDACQECCPYNKNVPMTHIRAFSDDVAPVLDMENLPKLHKYRPFNWRSQDVLERNLNAVRE